MSASDNVFSASIFAVITTMALSVAASAFQPDVLPELNAAQSALPIIEMETIVVTGRRTPEPMTLVAAAH